MGLAMTFKSFKYILVASIVTFTLTGCAPSISSDTYGTYSANQVNRTVKGVVDNTRVVRVQGTSTIGTLVGGAAGALAGSTIGGGRGQILGAIGGGLIGAGVGNVAEKQITQQQGMEYVIKTQDGGYISVVQGLTPTFQKGQHVMVIFGDKARVVADPDYSAQ